MISKIHKARSYAQDRERFSFTDFRVNFHGTNNDHVIEFHENQFACDCEYFKTRNVCSHTMALEKVLDHMIE